MYGLICFLFHRTGNFHLRLVCEGFAAAYLTMLATWAALSSTSILTRLLVTLLGLALVLSLAQFSLGGRYSAWIEVALWYVPVALIAGIGLRSAGFRVQRSDAAIPKPTFSIRWMMIATAVVASAIPLVRVITETRSAGQLASLWWLFDSLVIVVPQVLIAVGVIWGVLSNKLFHVVGLLAAAPLAALAVCWIYRWGHYQSIVVPAIVAAILITLSACLFRATGFRGAFNFS